MSKGAPEKGSFSLPRFPSAATAARTCCSFIPIAIALELTHASATIIFVTSAAGVIPTAALMGRATEVARAVGAGIGGFLNVTFGNAPELIIAFPVPHSSCSGRRSGSEA